MVTYYDFHAAIEKLADTVGRENDDDVSRDWWCISL